jgi:hypothetical protein
MEVTMGQIRAVRRMFKKFPLVLEFSPGLGGLYGIWHCLPVGLEIFCEFHLEASTELHSTMQNTYFHHSSENGLTVMAKIPKQGKHNRAS